MNTGTYISVVLIGNKLQVVISSSPEDHAAAVVELIDAGGRVMTEEIYAHALYDVVIQKGARR